MLSPSNYVIGICGIFSIPCIIFLLGLFLTFSTHDKSHNRDHVNACLLASYYVFAYSLILLEHLFFIPFFMALLQSFACGSNKMNYVGEIVAFQLPTGQCWNGEQIAVVSFGIFSAIIFLALTLLSYICYSSSFYMSPLPWADYNIFQKLTALSQKILISTCLIFDPQVN